MKKRTQPAILWLLAILLLLQVAAPGLHVCLEVDCSSESVVHTSSAHDHPHEHQDSCLEPLDSHCMALDMGQLEALNQVFSPRILIKPQLQVLAQLEALNAPGKHQFMRLALDMLNPPDKQLQQLQRTVLLI